MRTAIGGLLKRGIGAILTLAAAATTVHGQCQDEWTPMGSGTSGSVNVVRSMVVHDDGTGLALYIGGQFTSVNGVPANFIARWNGTTWSSVGSGVNGTVFTMAVYDSGSGPQLYVAGSFTTAGGSGANRIARWNGTTWSALGSGVNGSAVTAMCVHDDGDGPDLYIGGNFTTANGVSCYKIARYDGTNFSPLAGGIGLPSPAAPIVYALASFDDGSGQALYAGGAFSTADGANIPADRIARWDGSAWSALASGFDGQVNALLVHNDGSGPALYAGGEFNIGGLDVCRKITRWDGESWAPVGYGFEGGNVLALAAFDPGDGLKLYAAGDFQLADTNPAASIAVWDGAGWSAVGSGVDNGVVHALGAFDGNIHAGGNFASTGGAAASRLVRLQCNPLGACCLPSGACESRTQQACTVAGATYIGDASDCMAIPTCTPAPVGACCLPSGCVVLWNAGEGGCIAQGGVYQGDDSTCETACDGYHFEVEPNSSKLAAQFINLSEGGAIVGRSTANGAGEPGADYFRIHTDAAALAIYEHKLTLTTLGPAGHSTRIVSANQTTVDPGMWPCTVGTFIDGTDSNGGQVHQLDGTSRVNYWYGFGKEEGIYLHVWGADATTGVYILSLDTTEIVPTNLGNFETGEITISTIGQGHNSDTALMILDENLVPIPGYGNDGASTNGGAPASGNTTSFLRRTYAPGTYYMAIGINNLASTVGKACDDNRRFGAILDLPDAVVATDSSTVTDVSFAFTDTAGTTQYPANRPGRARAAWYRFTVGQEPCAADFDGNSLLEVTDIFAFLTAWFAMDPTADFDGDEVLAVPDIFAFLTAWFAGCP